MKVTQLNRDQLTRLKQNYYCNLQYVRNIAVSYSELADIDELVSDQEVFNAFKSMIFSEDDLI